MNRPQSHRILIIVCLFSVIAGSSLSASIFSHPKTVEEIQRKIASLPDIGRERTKAALYSELGTTLYKKGSYKEGREAFEKALQYRTTKSMKRHIYRFLGKCYEASDRLDKAIYAYGMSVEYDRKNWRRHRDLAWVYYVAHLYPEAITSYQSAILLDPKKDSLYFGIGRCWSRRGLFKKAEDNFVRALDRGTEPNLVFRELAIIFEKTGRFQEAASLWDELMTDTSSTSDWGRLIYSAALAQDHALSKKGLDKLYDKKSSEETIRFYEDIVGYLGNSHPNILTPNVTSVKLRTMLEQFRQSLVPRSTEQ